MCQPRCPSPRPVQHHVERSLLSLWLLQWEKTTHGRQPEPQNCGSLCSDLTSKGLQENLCGSTTGNLTSIEKGRGACNNQLWDLSRASSYLQYPSGNSDQQFCSSAEPTQGCALAREYSGVQICLVWSLMAQEPSLPMLRQGAKS